MHVRVLERCRAVSGAGESAHEPERVAAAEWIGVDEAFVPRDGTGAITRPLRVLGQSLEGAYI